MQGKLYDSGIYLHQIPNYVAPLFVMYTSHSMLYLHYYWPHANGYEFVSFIVGYIKI